MNAGLLLGKEGLFVEPSSSTALALARQMREEGIIGELPRPEGWGFVRVHLASRYR